MIRLSIKTRLTVAVSGLLLVLLSMTAHFALLYYESHFKAAITAQELTLLAAIGNEIDSKIELVHNTLIASAEAISPEDAKDPARMQIFLDNRLSLHALFDRHLFLFSPSGALIAESPFTPGRRGLDVSFRDYFRETLASKAPYISAPYISTRDSQPTLMFTAPVLDKDGNVAAILAGSLYLLNNNFLGNLTATRLGDTGFIYLFDRDRTIIIHPDKQLILEKDIPVRSSYLFDPANVGFKGSGETINSQGVPILATYQPLHAKNWILAANHPLEHLYAPLEQVKTYFVISAVFAIAFILLSVQLLLGRLLAPLVALTRHVGTISDKTGAKRLSKIRSDDEIGALSEAFNQMILELDRQRQSLAHRESLYRTLADFSSELAFWRSPDKSLRYISPNCERITGYTDAEFYGNPELLDNIIHPEDRSLWFEQMRPEQPAPILTPLRLRMITKAGAIRWVSYLASPVYNEREEFLGFRGSQRDFTERRQTEQALRDSENKYRGIFEAAHDAIFVETPDGQIMDVNPAACKLLQYSREELIGRNFTFLLPPEANRSPAEFIKERLDAGGIPFSTVNIRKDGVPLTLEVMTREFVSGDQLYVVVVARDITERKQMEEKLRFLSLHDPMTGLYDRAFFEQDSARLSDKKYAPVGVIVCDIDGLKLVNDTLGHAAGDELIKIAAALIKNCFRETDVVARIGGDEFAILLPSSPRHRTECAGQRVIDAVYQYNLANPTLPLSISVGCAIGDELGCVNVSDLFQEADDNMYREKLKRSQDARQSIIHSILREAEIRDALYAGHGDRLAELAERLAETIDLPKSRITALLNLAKYHDIGKVGVRSEILFNPCPLTPEELSELKRHPDIGRRIAQSIPPLSGIADFIWKHHEWWNGQGYPLGLKHEEIPLECRILAIVDAYDEMTHDQPYRQAMSQNAAVTELRRAAGRQFDPTLVEMFLQVLDSQPDSSATPGKLVG